MNISRQLFKFSPLSGTKVLDLSRVLAGPMTSMLPKANSTSETGHRVSKIEN